MECGDMPASASCSDIGPLSCAGLLDPFLHFGNLARERQCQAVTGVKQTNPLHLVEFIFIFYFIFYFRQVIGISEPHFFSSEK